MGKKEELMRKVGKCVIVYVGNCGRILKRPIHLAGIWSPWLQSSIPAIDSAAISAAFSFVLTNNPTYIIESNAFPQRGIFLIVDRIDECLTGSVLLATRPFAIRRNGFAAARARVGLEHAEYSVTFS